LQYSRELDDLEPVFDDCPALCHYYGDGRPGRDYCDGCDKGELRKAYIEETTGELGGDREKFERYRAAVTDALAFEGLPADLLTIPAAEMVSIVDAERARIIRVKTWNAKQAAEAAAANAGK
jgi:hypothetical protein